MGSKGTSKEGYVRVAGANEMSPGSIKVVDGIDRVGVCLINLDGKYYAVSGICTHKGAPLSEGELKGNYIQCPWHKANFRVQDGSNHWPASKPLRTFDVKVENGSIFVRIPPRKQGQARAGGRGDPTPAEQALA